MKKGEVDTLKGKLEELKGELKELKEEIIEELIEKLEKSLPLSDVALDPELMKELHYSAKKAEEILRISKDGKVILYFDSEFVKKLTSYIETSLHVRKTEVYRCDLNPNKLDIPEKSIRDKDVFVFGYIEKEDKETLRNIINYGIKLVKEGMVKSFNYFNVNPGLHEIQYRIDSSRLERSKKYGDKFTEPSGSF